jgi:hypothetical protein
MPIDYGTNNVSSSGNISVSGIVTAISGVFTNLTFNGTVVSISGHTHTASSITDFNEAVDDRIGSGLFVAGTGINLNYNDSTNSFTVSVTGVSFSGHTHTSSNITDFNSSVSGLLPTISNSGNNRILTSTGSTVGINAESNLTFDGTTFVCSGSARIGNLDYIDVDDEYVFIRNFNDIPIFEGEELILNSSDGINSVSWGGRSLVNNYGQPNFNWSGSGVSVGVGASPVNDYALYVTGSGYFSNNVTINNQTANTIAGFDGNKNITSLATGTYPSLTELSYVKGVTSALQTQLNAKQNTLTNPVTGTGAANHIAYWTSSSGIAHDASQLFWDATNNRLGVGTALPSGTLNVIGTGLFSTTTGIIPNALLDLYSATSGDMIFNVEGTNGSLFSVIDNLSGTLMSVNNNAGLPVFEVFSDDRVIGGRYNQNDFVISSGGNVGIGTASPTSKLHVIGSGLFSSDINANRFISSQSSGDEGGEILLNKPATNSSISGNLTIDLWQNRLRIFETTGSNRGYYLDITEGAATAGTPLKTKTLRLFTALDNQPPASAFATLDTRNSIAVLDFDDTTEESAVFVGVVPDNANLASGLSVRIHWMATTATSGNCRCHPMNSY